MNLTPHFTLEELTASQTATRLGLDNTPDDQVLANLHTLCERLEQVRSLLGKPMLISSGYRSNAVNRAVGGVSSSAHTQGLAVDFICPGFGPVPAVAHTIAASDLEFDQLIHEGTWVHLAVAAPGKQERRQVLTAHFHPGGPTTYTTGLA